MVSRDKRETWDSLEKQENRVIPVCKVPQECPDEMEKTEVLALLVSPVSRGLQENRDQLVYQVYEVCKESKAIEVNKAAKERKGILEKKGQRETMDNLGGVDWMGIRDIRDHQARVENPEILANLVAKV